MMQHATRAGESISSLRVTDTLQPAESETGAREMHARLWRSVGRAAPDFLSSAGAEWGGELDFLAGGGEMGALIRAHDWSTTSLGPPGRWPRSLRNALRLLLAAPYPMSIAWGPELLQFSNDAYARLLGARGQPHLLGPSARELFTDIRPTVGPLINSAMQRGESSVVEDHLICLFRNGYAEETYLTFRFDPIPDDTGGIGGVLVTLTETTDRVINRRRTAALRGLASEAAGARSMEEACRRALAEISRHPTDIPFALLYVRDAGGGRARLVATAGLPAGAAASPELIELGAPADASNWPVAAAITSNDTVVVDDLPTRFGTLPAGDWPLAPRSALVIPLTPPGCDQPEAVLIAGVSARRALDAECRGFIELVARQVTAAIAGGRAYEDEKRHAEAAAAAARLARARRRARERALEARFAGVLEERTRMAREIHDTLLQGVTGIALQLRAALPHVRTAPDAAADSIERIVELADATIRDARRAVWDMRAPAMADGDFPAAMRAAAERAVAGTALTLDYVVQGTPRPLDPDLEDVMFRVAQEAIANVVKHAHARTVRVALVYKRGGVRLAVSDDGRGFAVDPDFRAYAGHWGLLGMRERADRIGATLTVISTVGAGATVELRAPRAPMRLPGAGR